jgi:hypothetical protein
VSGLIGGAAPLGILVETDYRERPARDREEKGWPSSGMLGGAQMIIEGSWWEDTDAGWGGPNYAPNAYTLTGPTVSSGITSAAAVAIYDTP